MAISRFLALCLASYANWADGLAASTISHRAAVAASMSVAPAAPVAAPEDADSAELVRRLEDAMDLYEARERYGDANIRTHVSRFRPMQYALSGEAAKKPMAMKVRTQGLKPWTSALL